MRRAARLAPVALAALSLLACGELTPMPDRHDAGEPRHVLRAGNGTPTVVLQAGHGDGASTWRPVFDSLARHHAVVAYDRPGYGAHAAAKTARDPCTIATEQRALLRQLGVPPPYLLVGHSLGGRYQWVYAALYPQDVAGLVLIEPTHPEHWQRLQAQAPAMATTIKALRVVFNDTMRREFDQQDHCLVERIGSAQIAALRRIPARILARESYALPERGAFEQMHRQTQQDWLALLGAKQVDTVARSGHYIHRDRPDVVVGAVDELAESVRRRTPQAGTSWFSMNSSIGGGPQT